VYQAESAGAFRLSRILRFNTLPAALRGKLSITTMD
jgi:hypothetical protein